VTERGDVYWADLGDPGEPSHRPAKLRPVLVVQSDPYNRSRLATVVVVSLTSNLAAAEKPGNVFLTQASSGLPKDSVANVTQVATLNRLDLVPERLGNLPLAMLRQVDAGLRLVLGL
jgi:mRNA interferase MazF